MSAATRISSRRPGERHFARSWSSSTGSCGRASRASVPTRPEGSLTRRPGGLPARFQRIFRNLTYQCAVHLLVVEDDPRLAALLARLLGEDRHVVEVAATGREAIDLA